MGIGALIAIAAAIAFVVWLAVGCGSSKSNSTTTAPTSTVAAISARAATRAELRALAVQVGHPIYWVGPESGRSYELTRTASDRIFIRYLPHGVKPGTKSAAYTFVGTYPFNGAYKALQGLAKKKDDASLSVPGGGLAVYARSSPTNIYVAFPGSDVGDRGLRPCAKRARSLVASGQVQPVR